MQSVVTLLVRPISQTGLKSSRSRSNSRMHACSRSCERDNHNLSHDAERADDDSSV